MILPDLIQHNLRVVFCGTAAGNKSAGRRAYYAHTGNRFYPTLASCGFTPRILKPSEFPELLKYSIGLTDLVKQHFGVDKYLKKDQYDTEGFEQKIIQYQPKIVCFNGKESAREYLNLKRTAQVLYGLQQKTIGKSKLYVAPSTSPGNKAHWDESLWQSLKRYT